MKKLLFMMFILGGLAVTFSSCGGDEAEGEENTESAEGESEEGGH